MTEPRFKIVFDGTLLPGVEPDNAKENLAVLFKTQRDAVERLFSGRPVALKRDLAEADAQKYLMALNKAGLDARIEADAAPSLSLVDDVTPVVANAPAEMTCPKCGHTQAMSAECSACGIIIAKYKTVSSAPEERPLNTQTLASPFAPPTANVSVDEARDEEVGELKVWSFDGRIGRLRYFSWVTVISILLAIVSAALGMIFNPSTLMRLLISTVLSIAATPIAAKRSRDLGWSGWWAFLIIIPIANLCIGLAFTFMPGMKGANAYGPPPPPNSLAVKIIAWTAPVMMIVILVGIIAAIAIPAYSGHVGAQKLHQATSYQQPPTSP